MTTHSCCHGETAQTVSPPAARRPVLPNYMRICTLSPSVSQALQDLSGRKGVRGCEADG